MKSLTFSFIALFFAVAVLAQTPQSFRYQAIARDNSGNILVNQSVSFRISILSGSISGTEVYKETHTGKITNAFGLVELEIGKGTPVTGTFSSIDWGDNSYFVKVEMDPAGGNAYQVLSTSQLLSVPYALHAKTVETGDNWGAQIVQTNATLSGQGTAANPLKIAQQSATNGQILKWNGTTWAPAKDNDGSLTLPFSGTATSDGPIFRIVNLGTSGGISTTSTGNYGIWGESTANMGIGVYGVNKTSSGTTFGVFGDVYSPTGYSGYFQGGSVFIQGNTGIGVQSPSAKLEVAGQVKITGGNPGISKVLTSDAEGLASWQSPTLISHNHIGEKWYASVAWAEGAFKVTNSLNGPSIWGVNSGGGNAIRGDGFNNSIGVFGGGVDGTGVKGSSYNGNGVEGSTSSSSSYSGYFTGGKFYVDGNTGIGTQNPEAKLEVAGQVKITGGNPGTGKVLTSDASGLASWATLESNSGPWLTSGNKVYYNNGPVGIGTSNPNYRFTVYDDTHSSIQFLNSTSGTGTSDGFLIQTEPTGSPVWIWNFENSNMHFATNNLNRMIIDADGHVSMMSYLDLNTEGTYAALKVGGKQALWSDGTYFSWGYDANYNYFARPVAIGDPANHTSYMLYVKGNAYTTGTWGTSDVSFKKNISLIDNSLEKVMNVRGVSFEFRSDEFKDYQFAEGKQFGFIAQELEKEFPELVRTDNDGYKSVNYNGMIPVLLEALKEQQKAFEDLKAENDKMKNTTKELEINQKILTLRIENLETFIKKYAENNTNK